MANEGLFEALAQAEARPSKAYRAAISGADALKDTLGGYLQGRQINMQMQQPEALARLLNATPQGHEIVQTMGPAGATAAMYRSNPKDVLDYAGKQAQLAQQGDLGYANIAERNTASQRAADQAAARTKSQASIFGGKNLSSNIALHENEIQRLNGENTTLSTKLPSGITGMVKQWLTAGGVMPPALQDPQVAGIASQMKNNQAQINFHQQVLQPMYKSQGLIPPSMLDNSDLGNINPPPTAGGDSSIVTGLPGFGQ